MRWRRRTLARCRRAIGISRPSTTISALLHAHRKERRQEMLGRGNAGAVAADDGGARRIDHVLGSRGNANPPSGNVRMREIEREPGIDRCGQHVDGRRALRCAGPHLRNAAARGASLASSGDPSRCYSCSRSSARSKASTRATSFGRLRIMTSRRKSSRWLRAGFPEIIAPAGTSPQTPDCPAIVARGSDRHMAARADLARDLHVVARRRSNRPGR